MKQWLCNCGRRKETKDNVVMAICNGCQEKMKEIKGDGERTS